MSSPRAMRVAGIALRRSAALGEIPFLVRAAYSAVPDEPLLDVPCGALASLEHAARVDREAPVVGLDLSESMLGRARRRFEALRPAFGVQLVLGDALELPFEDGSFGSVLSINGLLCMPDPARFAAELARVAHPGAPLTMTSLVSTGSRAGRLVNAAFRRGGVIPDAPPTLDELLRLLEDAGWTDAEVRRGTGLVAITASRG